jgi:CDP-2,3-bis-(O-geranylgeranyl)-sn-glycerol synthase
MSNPFYDIIIYPIIYIWPAYVANGAPVIFGRYRQIPLDMGKKIGGKPIFGSHKTVIGLISGLASGFLMAGIESLFIPYMLAVGIALTIGTHFGDLLGSFIKRRIGHKEGARTFILDQYTFLIFALLFAYPFGNLPDIYGIIFLVILTGVLHPLTNLGAHRLKIKKVPW